MNSEILIMRQCLGFRVGVLVRKEIHSLLMTFVGLWEYVNDYDIYIYQSDVNKPVCGKGSGPLIHQILLMAHARLERLIIKMS